MYEVLLGYTGLHLVITSGSWWNCFFLFLGYRVSLSICWVLIGTTGSYLVIIGYRGL